MNKKSISYDKEIVNTILLLNSIHLVFQSFSISQLACYNNIFAPSKLIEES
jgi:hypothetical protein